MHGLYRLDLLNRHLISNGRLILLHGNSISRDLIYRSLIRRNLVQRSRCSASSAESSRVGIYSACRTYPYGRNRILLRRNGIAVSSLTDGRLDSRLRCRDLRNFRNCSVIDFLLCRLLSFGFSRCCFYLSNFL